MKRVMIIGLLAVLAGCQTNYKYVPIVSNPRQIDMAEAQCQMMSSSAQQGMIAWGSQSYVAGAQIGNAIGNAIRVDQFMQQCMTLQGWKRVTGQQKVNSPPPRQMKYSPVTSKPIKGKGAFPAAPNRS